MTAPEIVTFLVERGHFVDYDAQTKSIWIRPEPSQPIVDRVNANEAMLVEYFSEMHAPPASAHSYVTTKEAGTGGVCVACGIPWLLHGKPPETHWLFVPQGTRNYKLRQAWPIEVATVEVPA